MSFMHVLFNYHEIMHAIHSCHIWFPRHDTRHLLMRYLIVTSMCMSVVHIILACHIRLSCHSCTLYLKVYVTLTCWVCSLHIWLPCKYHIRLLSQIGFLHVSFRYLSLLLTCASKYILKSCGHLTWKMMRYFLQTAYCPKFHFEDLSSKIRNKYEELWRA